MKCIEDEIPFGLPDGWEWTRLGTIIDIERGGSPRPIKAFITNESNGINWIKIGDVEKGGKYIYQTHEKIKPEGKSKSREVFPGDFLLTNSMSFGRPYISKINGCIHDGWLVLRNPDKAFDIDYLYYLLSSKYIYGQFTIKASGSTVDNLNVDKVADAIIPLPPIDEQIRIAKKIEASTQIIKTVEINQIDLLECTTNAKSKILDLAIRGQLVPQNSDDEPASVLLDRIRSEKEELIKQGKIKRDKKESVIFKGDDNSYYRNDGKIETCIDNELPFAIPDTWAWCNLSMIGSTNIGLTYKPTDICQDGTMVLRSSNIVDGQIDLTDLVRVSTPIRPNQYMEPNDILICARNGSKALVGKCAVFKNIPEKASFGAFMAVYRSTFYRYIYYFLNTDAFKDTFKNDDSKQINQLTQDMIKNTLIPLPPQKEQDRITSTISKFFEQIDKIADLMK